MSKYTDYNFNNSTKLFIDKCGFVDPTEIQQKVIPLACKGNDIVGLSATGSGKTHAFLIPIFEKINPDIAQVQAVITAPTRELATQIYDFAKIMCEVDNRFKVRLITGGIERDKMVEKLSIQPQIVIGTPGRIKDLFLEQTVLRVDTAKIFVVDEADMTLEYGFLDDIDAICGRMDRKLQMLVFSATIPQGLNPFLKKYLNQPNYVQIKNNNNHNKLIKHCLVPCKHLSYSDMLLKVLTAIQPYLCLIFANTRLEAISVCKLLKENGYDALEIHGDLEPRARRQAMKRIRELKHPYIVATDIAARGIDIEGVSHVISLGLPEELDFYIHRAGRTGRNNKTGNCYLLYNEKDQNKINLLIKKGISFDHQTVKNEEWKQLNPYVKTKKDRKPTELDLQINKIVSRKDTKVKPGYKKKRQMEIEKLKRKYKRNQIQAEIKSRIKERAIVKQRQKREESL